MKHLMIRVQGGWAERWHNCSTSVGGFEDALRFYIGVGYLDDHGEAVVVWEVRNGGSETRAMLIPNRAAMGFVHAAIDAGAWREQLSQEAIELAKEEANANGS